jgi:hypothetical protein
VSPEELEQSIEPVRLAKAALDAADAALDRHNAIGNRLHAARKSAYETWHAAQDAAWEAFQTVRGPAPEPTRRFR